MALPSNTIDRENQKFVEDTDGNVAVRTQISPIDIQIGAVEIKDDDSTNRLEITSSNEAKVVESSAADIKTNTDNIPSDPSTEAKQDDIITALKRDDATGALIAITYPHHEVHGGDSFKADINTDDLQNEGDENALHISFTTANTTKWMHLVVEALATGTADLSIVEAPTGGVSGGDELTIFNKDRNSDTTSGAISTGASTTNKMTDDASAPTGGTVIHHCKFGSGKNKVGGEARSIEEFILKQNTKYSFRMTTSTASIIAQLTLHWYEHTNLA